MSPVTFGVSWSTSTSLFLNSWVSIKFQIFDAFSTKRHFFPLKCQDQEGNNIDQILELTLPPSFQIVCLTKQGTIPNILFYEVHKAFFTSLPQKLNLEVGEEWQRLGTKFRELLNCYNPYPQLPSPALPLRNNRPGDLRHLPALSSHALQGHP